MNASTETLWHYTDGTSSFGPFSTSVIQQLITTGVVAPGFHLRRDWEESWTPLDQVNLDAPPQAAFINVRLAPPDVDEPNYHLARDGAKWGPLRPSELRAMLDSNQAKDSDMVWKEGMTEWLPLGSIPELLKTRHVRSRPPIAPPPQFSQIPKTALSNNRAHHNALPTRFKATPTITLNAASALSFAIFMGCYFAGNRNVGPDGSLFFGLWLLTMVAAIICGAVLHYQLWSLLPQEYRATTPGKAVGLMFIPIYNIFWSFTTWPKLAEGLRHFQERIGQTPANDNKRVASEMAISSAAFFGLILLMMITPFGNYPVSFAVIGYLYLNVHRSSMAFASTANRIAEVCRS